MTSSKNNILYRLENVTRIIGDEIKTTLVSDMSFDITTHQFISVTGPSGSGKSSLLYLLGFLDEPTSGSIYFEGKKVTGLSKEELAQIRLEKLGFIFQFHFLLPELKAIENIMLPMQRLGKLTEKQIKNRALDILEHLDLKEHGYKYPHQLSGGQRQRVSIARALVNNPHVILADEPTGSLDSMNGERVFQIFKDLVQKEGKTIVMVTHNPELAEQTDHQINIVDGKIVSEH